MCIALILIAWLRLITGFDHMWLHYWGYRTAAEIGDHAQVLITGKVYQKRSDKIYLTSIKIIHIYSESADEILQKQENAKLKEHLIIEKLQDNSEISIGDSLVLRGEVALYNEATNPGEFDSRAYYQSIGIGGKLKKVEIVEQRKERLSIREWLNELRGKWHDRLYKILPEREASIMATMLLGEKEELDEQIREVYQKNGIIHILSISGLHITLIGMGAFGLLRKFGFSMKCSAIIGGLLLVGYGILTGMSISATRAIGMYVIRMGAHLFRRTYDLLTGLCLMAAVSCTMNPGCLRNSGFLLSYGAVMGPVVFLPAMNCLLLRKRTDVWKEKHKRILEKIKNGLLQSICASLSISMTTMPILLKYYYEMPLYSVFLNVLVLPFMGILVGSGLIGMMIPGLGISTTFSYWILQYYDVLCTYFSRLPFYRLNPGCPKGWRILLYYCIWVIVILLGKIHVKKRNLSLEKGLSSEKEISLGKESPGGKKKLPYEKILVLSLIGCMICLMLVRGREQSRVTFLNVGQGDCIIVECESGEVYAFDCGSSSRRKVGEYVLLPYLKYRGIQKLNAVYISHDDSDHRNGMDELLELATQEGICIEKVFEPGEICASEVWETESGYFECLHPEKGDAFGDNASSQCFYVKLSGKETESQKGKELRILLTGDVEKEGEQELIARIDEKCRTDSGISHLDVLKVAHHGSAYSTGNELLQRIRPKIAVISCGKNNPYGHPHKETIQRLETIESQIITTMDGGAITIENVGNGWEIHTFLNK